MSNKKTHTQLLYTLIGALYLTMKNCHKQAKFGNNPNISKWIVDINLKRKKYKPFRR